MWQAALACGACAALTALSFVATPVKFIAEGVPIEHLLAIGRVTFRASLAVEISLILPLALLLRGRARISVMAAAVLLAVQWLALMPSLDARTLARIAGQPVGPAPLHIWWIIADLARIGIYGSVAVGALRRLAITTEPK